MWIWLALGWGASGVDRTITGPVISYMIDNKVTLLQGVENPFAVGGLVGSLLFAGYMLMQFPGGHLGDRLGHRTVIVIKHNLGWFGYRPERAYDGSDRARGDARDHWAWSRSVLL